MPAARIREMLLCRSLPSVIASSPAAVRWAANVARQALAEVNRAHRLEHRQLSRRHRETAGTALSLGGHDGVAAVHVDAGPTDVQRAGV